MTTIVTRRDRLSAHLPRRNRRPRYALSCALLVACAACAESAERAPGRPTPQTSIAPRPAPRPRKPPARVGAKPATPAGGPGFPEAGPWVSFYGTARQMGDLERVASSFRIINIDADPTANGEGNFSDAQIATLRNGGRNRVLSYLNLGSCERFRTYWRQAPEGFVPCATNRAAWLGTYEGYPDETWMDLGNPDYQRLLVEYVATRLDARGVDGFYLDNLELVEHVAAGSSAAFCSPDCRRGALDVVRRLRERFPDKLLVMQNATGEGTRRGVTGGVAFPTLLDGVVHEEVYSPAFDATAEQQLIEWQGLGLASRSGHPFFVGVEDYVGTCRNVDAAKSAYARSRSHGFSPYASDASSSQKVVCYWAF